MYEMVNDKVRSGTQVVKQFGKLFYGLARDDRVPLRNKVVFGAIAAYLVIPFDVVPDWFPGIGQLDDLMLVALALDGALNRTPRHVVADHWDGPAGVLDGTRRALSTATALVPSAIKDKLFLDASV